jgi:hypothetical protein
MLIFIVEQADDHNRVVSKAPLTGRGKREKSMVGVKSARKDLHVKRHSRTL